MIFSIAALWKYDSATHKFKNKKGYTLKGEFAKPPAQGAGFIEAKNLGTVLGFEGTVEQPAVENTEVKLEGKKQENNKNQMWIFSQIDNLPATDGFFTIKSVSTKMLLHGNSKGKAYLGSEFFNLKYDYNTEPESKLITSRKKNKCGKKDHLIAYSLFLRCRLAYK